MSSGNNPINFIYKTAYVCLFIVALLGLLLRTSNFIGLPLPYRYILHAHSHTALLGWAFLMGCFSILTIFKIKIQHYGVLPIILITSIFGMLGSFLYQGYGAISITFSTIFVISSYITLFKFYKGLPINWLASIFKRAIIWFFISTLGIWVLGPTSIFLGKDHWLYEFAIQFFMHFQINGWLFYVALGTLLYHQLPNKESNRLYTYLIKTLDVSLILGLAPLAYWVSPTIIFSILNYLNVLCILIFTLLFLRTVINHSVTLDINMMLLNGLIILKALALIPTLFPDTLISLEYNRNLIIAYIHLVLLGIVSGTYIMHTIKKRYLSINWGSTLGIILFVLGFLSTELILTYQGIFKVLDSLYNIGLYIGTIFLVLGILLLNVVLFTNKKKPLREERLKPN